MKINFKNLKDLYTAELNQIKTYAEEHNMTELLKSIEHCIDFIKCTYTRNSVSASSSIVIPKLTEVQIKELLVYNECRGLGGDDLTDLQNIKNYNLDRAIFSHVLCLCIWRIHQAHVNLPDNFQYKIHNNIRNMYSGSPVVIVKKAVRMIFCGSLLDYNLRYISKNTNDDRK